MEGHLQEALDLSKLIPEDTFSQKLFSESLSLHGRVGVDVVLRHMTWPRLCVPNPRIDSRVTYRALETPGRCPKPYSCYGSGASVFPRLFKPIRV